MSVEASPAETAAGDQLRGMARGGSLNLVGAVANQGALFAVTAVLALALGAGDVGRYAECYALLSLLGLLSLCGFRAGLTRFVAIHLADRDAASLRGTVRLGMGLSIGAAVALGAGLVLGAPWIAALFHDPGLATGIQLIGLTLPAATFTDAALAATQGWRTQRPFTLIGRVYEPLTRLALTGLALVAGYGLSGAFWALVLSSWTASVLAGRALQIRMRASRGVAPRYDLRPIFSFSMISWVSTLASTGLIWADTLLLGALTDPAAVGVYSVATRLVTLAVFVMAPINAAFAPHIAHVHHTSDAAEVSRFYGAATSWIVRLSTPAFVVLLVFPADLLRFFGPAFTAGAAVTAILAVGKMVDALTGPCGTVLNMSGRVAVNMTDTIAALVLNVALNLWLIPQYGIIGAAVAWSASLIAVNATRLAQVRYLLGVTLAGSGVVRGLIAGLPALAVAVLVRATVPGTAGLLLGILAVLLTYGGALLLLGITDTDRELLQMVRRRGQPRPVEAAPEAR